MVSTHLMSIFQYFNTNAASGSSSAKLSGEMKAGIGVSGVAGLVLLTVLVFFALRRHKNKKNKDMVRRAEEDENPVYGLYECDPDPHAEVEDTNDYYDCMDEEGVAVTRDNNSMYESDRE